MKLIQNWREGWKFYSVWVYALLLALPELYSQLMYSGLLNEHEWPKLVNVMRSFALLGLALRFVDQSRPGGGTPNLPEYRPMPTYYDPDPYGDGSDAP